MKKLIATALFTGAFAAGTVMTAPAEPTSRTAPLPSADKLYDLLEGDTADETPPVAPQ
ncbi:hypothetical protein ACFUT3_13670 [Streptomyces cinereoruber]|uniref:hypothetical protein n=1 Tax=Streptomyces cinereoruber TaxID=67260 RepID=UPI00362801B3